MPIGVEVVSLLYKQTLKQTPKHPKTMKRIREWNYKPAPIFYGRNGEKRFFGVELEVYPKRGTTRYACQELLATWEAEKGFNDEQFIYLKTDGSLDERADGFEIVSHPVTLSAIHGKHLFSGLSECLVRSYKYQSCGIHVHVSRESTTPAAIAKVLYFLAEPQNEALLIKIAQRDWNRFCKQHRKGTMKSNLGLSGSHYYDRYQALNLRNQHTIEFRFFKGNVREEAIGRAVEFCDAILNYAHITTAPKMSAEGFVEYVMNARKTRKVRNGNYKYYNLRNFLRGKDQTES